MNDNGKIESLDASLDDVDFFEALHSLVQRWSFTRQRCDKCGRDFFGKSGRMNCGDASCSERSNFLFAGERHLEMTCGEVAKRFRSYFVNAGYPNAPACQMVNETGTTLFVVAANQILDPVVFQEKNTEERRACVAQPSIRTQFREVLGKEEGFSTSFVNIATLILSPSLEEHFQAVDDWVSFLSSCGFTVEDIQLRIRTDRPDWGGKKFRNIVLDVNYQGIQLGDAVLNIAIPQNSRSPLTVSDIGFGVERMSWALQKNPSYFSSIAQKDFSKDQVRMIDGIRTVSLIAGSGIMPSNKGRGYRFRLFLKEAMPLGRRAMNHYLKSSYDYWADFISLPCTFENVERTVNEEIDRNINLEICNKLGLKKGREFIRESVSDFLVRLESQGVDTVYVRDLIQVYE